MATKEIVARVKVQFEAGRADLARIAQNLGPTGVSPVQVKETYDAATAAGAGMTTPATVTVYADRSFDLVAHTPATSALLLEAAGLERGSTTPSAVVAGEVSAAAVREIARTKLVDLNTTSIEAAERTVAGTARSMGLRITA